MNRKIERPLVIVMFIITLLLLFAYVFYISFLKKTIDDEGQIISTDVRNTILSSIRNNTSNDIDDDDFLAKIMLRKELIQKNIFVRQIQRQESVRELSRLLAISRSEVGVNADEEMGGMCNNNNNNNKSVDGDGDDCGEDAAPVRRICRRRRHDDPEPECSICLEHYSSNDVIAWAKDGGEAPPSNGNGIVTSTGCAHIFHKECLFAWLQDRDGCPLCRRRVVHADAHVRFAGW